MLNVLIPAVGIIIDKIFPNADEAAKAKLKLIELEQAGDLAHLDADLKIALAQINVNNTEAQSTSLFVSGWRPAVGWVSVIGLAYTFLAQPLLTWASTTYGVLPPPPLDTGTLITLLGGMLGLSGLRSTEKIKGVARS